MNEITVNSNIVNTIKVAFLSKEKEAIIANLYVNRDFPTRLKVVRLSSSQLQITFPPLNKGTYALEIKSPSNTIKNEVISLYSSNEHEQKYDHVNPTFNSIYLDTTPDGTLTTLGQVSWAEAEETIQWAVEGGTIDGNKEWFDIYVDRYNNLVEGNVVSVTSISGNRQAVSKTDNTDRNSATSCIGMVTHKKTNGRVRITKHGRVRNLNTNGLTEGMPVYANSTGGYTQTVPTAPNYFIHVGIVEVANTNNGIIDVDIRVVYNLEDLSNVDGATAAVSDTNLFLMKVSNIWKQITWANLKIFFDTLFIRKETDGSVILGNSPNYTQFYPNGTLKMYGDATVFDDVTFDAIGLQQQGPGLSPNYAEGCVEFLTTANQADYLIINAQLPHARKNGVNVYPHVHFWQTENNVPNFAIQYRWQLNGGAKTTAWTARKCNSLAFTYTSGTLNQIAYVDGGVAPPTGDTISDIFQWRVLRDTTNALGLTYGADPYTTTVQVVQCDIHIQKDDLGSETEYGKYVTTTTTTATITTTTTTI